MSYEESFPPHTAEDFAGRGFCVVRLSERPFFVGRQSKPLPPKSLAVWVGKLQSQRLRFGAECSSLARLHCRCLHRNVRVAAVEIEACVTILEVFFRPFLF
jgi:hypothetical protein